MGDDSDIKQLAEAAEPIWEIAHRFGLDPYPVHFELVPATIMYEFGSYGLPGRFSHWSHGKVYHRMKTSYDYGLSKIYELVINTNPSYAFLMEGNSVLQNKLVMAHVLGHCDFFKNNAYFARTNRRMVETASLNAARIRQYEFEHGQQKVERFLDAVLSIQEHIDPYASPYARHHENEEKAETQPLESPASQFDDLFALTPDDKPTKPIKSQGTKNSRKVPARPEKDIVRFIMEHSRHLEPWQRDVMAIVHQEMLYFVPQMQTKVCNEGWACATGDSLVLTERGFVRFDQLYEVGKRVQVASGGRGQLNRITDFHKEELVPTIRIYTRRGLTVEGAYKHRIQLADGTWKDLSEVALGDRLALECGSQIWPESEVAISWQPTVPSPSLENVAVEVGVSVSTVIRHMKGRSSPSSARIDSALKTTAYQPGVAGKVLPTRAAIRPPATVNAELAWLLGYFVGDGNKTKSGICFTTGDHDIRTRLIAAIDRTLGLRATAKWDATPGGGRWRIWVHSRELVQLLEHLGIDLNAKAPEKAIPRAVLESPKHVMSAFLSGYFDADAYAGPMGVILSSSSRDLIRSVQTILLNYGILSSQRQAKDGCSQLSIYGSSAKRYLEEIGFGLERKQSALHRYIARHHWYKKEEASDPIVRIERGFADVYDITVESKHSYVANGFVNHNSFWHARIMRELDLSDEEYTDFATMNAGVLAPSRHSINPYFLGAKLLEDIERRWDNPTDEDRVKWGRQGGEGRKKLFEVREEENDVSLIRNYLTEQLVEDLDLYLYEREGDQWVIVDKNWEHVRDSIVSRMANFGNPTILVEDGDYHRNGELYMRHVFDGQELDVTYAEKTLEHIFALWGRPVHIESQLEDQPTVFSYDGDKHSRETL